MNSIYYMLLKSYIIVFIHACTAQLTIQTNIGGTWISDWFCSMCTVPREAKLTVWASINTIVNSKVCIIMAAIAYSIVHNLGLL